jgi:hypothetical protein
MRIFLNILLVLTFILCVQAGWYLYQHWAVLNNGMRLRWICALVFLAITGGSLRVYLSLTRPR